MVNKKITVSLIVLVVLAVGIYFGTHQVSTQDPPTSAGSTLPSFDAACFVHTGESTPRCDALKLTEVLEARSVTPQYMKYSDTDTKISFEYPSSVADVRKGDGKRGLDGTIYVEPIIPAYLGTEYWTGTSISIKQCGTKCPDNLLQYVQNWNIRSGSDTQERVAIDSPKVSIGGHNWIKASIGTPMGASYTLYVVLDKERLLSVTTDTENFTASNPHIAAVFKRVLETLAI